MYFRLVLLLGLGYLSCITANNVGDCVLSYNHIAVTTDQWKFGFHLKDELRDDTANGTVVASFEGNNIKSVTSFSSQFFTADFDSTTGELKIILSQPIDESKDTVQSPINIKVNFQCHTDTANIYIYVQLEDINNHKPTFDQTTYSYVLPMPFPIGIDIAAAFGDIYATDVDFTNTGIDFSLDETGNKYFKASLSRTEGKKFYVLLKSISRIDIESNVVFYITATDSATIPLQSSAQVTIVPDSQYSTPISPIFKDPIYISKVEEVNSAKKILLDIILEQGYETNLTLQFKDIQTGVTPWSEYFAASISESSVIVQLVKKLPDDLFNTTNAVVILQATRAGADHTGQTTLLITGPCSASTPDYPPAPCPGLALHFEQKEYNVIVKKNQIGLIAELKVVSEHQDEVFFSILSKDEVVKRLFRVGDHSGLLYVDEPLVDPPLYIFNVTADINSTKEHADVKVTVKVVNTTDGIQTPQFTESLEIHHIDEETAAQIVPNIIFPSSTNLSCGFVIKSQHPSGDFFTVSETSGVVSVNNKIDREGDIFKDMAEAVITLNLQIICSSSITNSAVSDTESNNLPNNPLQTVLMIYIGDINDNAPYFSSDKITVGYPVKELASRLQPKSVAVAKAYDKDTGTNAQIKYSLVSNQNDQMMVHSQTGAIYPLEGYKFEDMSLNILAQDQNGNQGCKNATLQVEIKMLRPVDVTILWIEDAVIEDVTKILSELRNISKYDIQVADSAVLSDNFHTVELRRSSARVKRDYRNTTKSLLRLIVYTIDSNGQVVSEEKLLQSLESATSIKSASSATALLTVPVFQQYNSLLIGVIIILASALVIVLLSVTIALYLVYVRPRRLNGFAYTDQFGSRERINKNMEPVDQSISPMDISENDAQVTSSSDTHSQSSVKTPPTITFTETSQTSEPPGLPTPPAPPAANTSDVSEKKSPAPRERKRSQPVRGDLIPDPDKLLSYRKHKPKEEVEDLPDPTVPGGGVPMPREPRQPGGEPIERKRSTVRFSPVIESIDQ